jgi:hypothetical protein
VLDAIERSRVLVAAASATACLPGRRRDDGRVNGRRDERLGFPADRFDRPAYPRARAPIIG